MGPVELLPLSSLFAESDEKGWFNGSKTMGDGARFVGDHRVAYIETFAIHLRFERGVVPPNRVEVDLGSLSTLTGQGMQLVNILGILLTLRAIHVKKAEHDDVGS